MHIYEFGDFLLDPAKRQLKRRDGTVIPLKSRVCDTLVYLVEHRGTVLDKERIMEAVWPDTIVEENNLAQAISKLRQIFGETPASHEYIVTVPSRGYRFVAEVKEHTADHVAPVITNADVRPPCGATEMKTAAKYEPFRSKKAWLLPALSVIVIGAFVALFFVRHRTPISPSPFVSAAADIPQKRIAVLPFKPVTAESRDPVLELGMADSLITKLSTSREIVVPSLASIRRYGALDQDPRAAGRELKVSSVLEGSVQRSGDHIRIRVRLINVSDGSSLWAGSFDEKFTDVFSVQDAISQKVANALALQLTGSEMQRLTKRYTENVDAYQLYLTGRYHWAKLTPPEIRTAIAFFQQAIEKDPNYALAYFGLAEANRSLAITSDVASNDCLPQAKAAAVKALEIDDSIAEGHASLSFSLIWHDWDWAGGETEAKRAIELNPNSAVAHFAYAHVLSDLGRHDEAISEQAKAIELEPVFLLLNALQGMYLYHADRIDEALIQLRKTLQIDPDFWITHLMLGKVYAHQQNYSEAIAEFSKAKDLSHGNSEAIASIGYAAALAGDKTKAMAVMGELKARAVQSYIPPYNIALVYNGLGDQNAALRSLEKAVDERDVRLTLLKVDPRWDSFRSEPHFLAILKRIGLQ